MPTFIYFLQLHSSILNCINLLSLLSVLLISIYTLLLDHLS